MRDEAAGVDRCLKLIESPTGEALAALRAEFRFLASVRHPQLVAVHDFGICAGAVRAGPSTARAFYFTSSFVEGVALSTFAHGRSFEEVKRPLVDALAALAALHRASIVHGDFKPENVLVEDGRGVLIDLSCARRMGSAAGAVSGTLGFLAPEVLAGAAPSARSDVYAVGKTLERLAAAAGPARPWPASMVALVGRATASSAAERPASAVELLELLGADARDLYVRAAEAGSVHGRDAVLDRGKATIDALVDGASGPRVLVVRGEAGSGRTRVLRELAWHAELGATLVEGFPRSGSRGVVYGTLARAIGRPDPAVAPTPSTDGSVSLARELDAAGTPVVLLFDDADRLEAADRDALRSVCRALRPDGCVLVALADRRPEEPPWADPAACTALVLESLDEPAVAAWASELGIADATTTLFRLSAGHPADVREVADRVARGEADTADAMSSRRATLQAAEVRASSLATSDVAARVSVSEDFEAAGALDRALAVLEAAQPASGDRDAPTSLAVRRAICHVAKGDPTAALGLLDEVDPIESDELRAAALDVRARALTRLGRHVDARAAAEAGLALARTPSVRADLFESAGVAASFASDHAAAGRNLSAAIALHADLASPRRLVRVLSYQAIDAYRSGDLDAALAGYRGALDVAERGGVIEHIARNCLNAATALHQRGDYAEALALYERGERVAAALGQEDLLAIFEFDLAKLFADLGAWDRAESRASRALRASKKLGAAFFEAAAASVLGDAALARGQVARAIEHFVFARETFEKSGSAREAAEEELELARAHLEADDVPGSSAALARVAESGALESADLRARAAMLEARIARARGEVARASRASALALAEAERSRSRDLVAMAAYASGDVARARSLWTTMADALPEDHRAGFRAHPRRRSVFDAPAAVGPPSPAPGPVERSERSATLERLLVVFRKLNSSLETRDILGMALDAAVDLTGAERGFIVLEDPDTHDLSVPVARNVDREQVGKSHLKFSRSIAEQAIATAEPVITVDAASDDRFRANASVHAMRLRSVIAVPIRSADGVLGALYLDNRFSPARFGTSDVDLLLVFADQVALALRTARMVEDLKRRTRELEAERARVEELARGQAREIDRLEEEVRVRREVLEHRHDFSAIIGRGPAMQRVFRTLDRVIDAPLPVLVLGESGTGKELVARAIHFQSARKAGPFIGLNCAALPATLLESELFGHVKGAFTGADKDRTGLVALATGGTLFLDELGELPLEMQAKLLRVLQEREVRPVGAAASIPVDFRLVSATNRDLRAEVSRGRFREDLYYRVGVVEVTLPPLRDRTEDLRALATYFAERAARDLGREPPTLGADALRKLAGHAWPGNVRELENVLTKTVVFAESQELRASDVELPRTERKGPRRAPRQDDERAMIERALEKTGWNAVLAARQLGMPRATFYRRLAKLGIVRS